jgi:hypothetical protein
VTLFDRLFGGAGRKAWSEPPFWSRPDSIASTFTVGDKEPIENSFEAYVEHAYKSNGIVFACILARLLPFTEARFMYQELIDGRPGDLHGGPGLDLLERPWPNGTTSELLAHLEQEASLAGNSYWTPRGEGASRRLRRLRPDWMTIVSGVRGDDDGSPFDLDAEVLGYIYEPKGTRKKVAPVFLTPEQVVHYSPIPDPLAQWRGMSWLTPIVREIQADSATTKHKLKFFENGATMNFVVKYDAGISPEAFKTFVAAFNEQHRGVDNAYKVVHLGGGADPTVIGADLKQLDFKATQGAGETRIAAAAGVGAIIARLSEGMQGSSLNAGNYGAAKRQFADMTLRPLWRTAAASLEKVTTPPPEHRLWTDTRDIAFLAEDQKDEAEILGKHAETVARLVEAGFRPDDVVRAVKAGDLSLLTGAHTGRYSVQLQPAGDGQGGET